MCLMEALRDPVLLLSPLFFFLFHPKFAYQAAAALNSERHNYGRRCGRGRLLNGILAQTPVGTFSDFNLEPFEKLRGCAEEPRGFPLTLTKDIMVNGKVLHLESSPPARIFKLGAPAASTTEQLDSVCRLSCL